MNSKEGIILFVDDEYYMLQTYKAIFRRDFREYVMLFAQSGREALDALSQYDPGGIKRLVVLSDWLMPGMKGDVLLKEIHQKFPMSVGFLLSGMINKEPDKEVFEQANIKKVIIKPWDNEHLKGLIIDTLKN